MQEAFARIVEQRTSILLRPWIRALRTSGSPNACESSGWWRTAPAARISEAFTKEHHHDMLLGYLMPDEVSQQRRSLIEDRLRLLARGGSSLV